MDQGSNMHDFPFTLTCSIRWVCKWYHVVAIQTSIRNEFRVSKFYPLISLKVHKKWSRTLGARVFWGKKNSKLRVLTLKGCFSYEKSHTLFGLWWSAELSAEKGDKVTFRSVQDPQVFGVLQELEPIYNDECILHVWSDSYKEDTAEDQRSKKPEISGTSLRSRQLLHGRMPLWAWFYWRGLWCGILVKSFGESEQKWQVILMSSGYRKSWSTYMPGPATVYLLRKIWQWKMQYLSDAIKIYLYFMI